MEPDAVPTSTLARICVFCGSSAGARPGYVEAARGLGHLLAARGIGLVYGGARVGLMGAIADAVLAGGGSAIGVIPGALVAREVAHPGLTELHVVRSMHERKALMAELSDGFIALPGGFGTLEELFEILTWSQLGLHRKPCGILNVEGYYDALLAFIDYSIAEAFVRPEYRRLLVIESTAPTLLAALAAYEPAHTKQWISAGET